MIADDVKVQMRAICARFPDPRSGTLACLHLAQEVEGYVTPEGIAAAAEATGAKIDEIESVVTFYSMYFRQRPGKYVIKVCTSISCYLRGCDDVLARLEETLDIRRGESTRDGKFTLQGVECLAACGMAPALQVNGEFVENVTVHGADALVERLRRGESVAGLGGHWTTVSSRPAGNGASIEENAADAGMLGEKAT